MATHQIAVTVDAGSIQVEPETLVMTSLDEVHWAGKNARKFSIVFDGAGPFAQRELRTLRDDETAAAKQGTGSSTRWCRLTILH